MKITIAAGGTGGHIYPGIAIAEEFLARDENNQVLFLTSRYGLGKKIIEKEGYPVKLISARGIIRKLSIKAFLAPFFSLIGFFQSIFYVLKFKPDLVVLMGGYVSFPVAFAAKLLGTKTVLHEQNVLPGIVSRILSKFVTVVILSFHESLKYIKNGIVLGNPVRCRILKIKKGKSDIKRILIMGGSQGAWGMNSFIIENLDKFFFENIKITHLIGERDFEYFKDKISFEKYPFYNPLSYMYNVEEGLSKTDLVISRAGATAIAEFLVVGIPSILIPFPNSAEGHQDKNAEVLANKNAAVVLDEKNISQLPKILLELISDDKKLGQMVKSAISAANPAAADNIVDLIYETAGNKEI
ncbi:undecaprenyldiphospho-muramoylpentapeptide beta-N-acetylglucosaminyltransferase [candidate division WOR-1 bacterium RIFOXYC2_FULL_37_10]|uniref:UDP-N-acetylglucosamine--N-acetylmuramyl-(pentapeptide) pyrophosphoryl-undecaprenol N-acetylglucosamine transferase n=1 Tax=candidate division WOR-1 bacterium RIFOXYB2_FULL_37_13 TaxID=1802579 RepID=A0A1F4SY91_UNCSA|nr:MAG: undecaprenyldiphospho-muramoylpentapeptide beta-N-acetylglucosaminyltransferase [candidate division WOR-1 bacterium RIFOXYB2_FULL_37_13]OGC36951.1 MAG: undecaprenyldiphospho-muramoylpentapeptide beta-N-acetylglucosaminyltransferase [candidate division WOR-1 bacterium RIFOXYC2_FULL_37_10]